MDSLRSYLLSVVAVCMIAAVSSVMVKNQMISKVIRLVSGILILLVVIAPLPNMDLEEISSHIQQTLTPNANELDDVENRSRQQLARQVQKSTQEHIEAIASQLGILVQATVIVSEEETPIPIAVELIGTLQPEQISTLSDYIEQNIGIPKEKQSWRGYETSG